MSAVEITTTTNLHVDFPKNFNVIEVVELLQKAALILEEQFDCIVSYSIQRMDYISENDTIVAFIRIDLHDSSNSFEIVLATYGNTSWRLDENYTPMNINFLTKYK